MDWNLPKIIRDTVSDEKINKSLADANLPQQIEDAFKKENLKKDIAKKVSVNLKGQIEKRAEDIKYTIESRKALCAAAKATDPFDLAFRARP